jgi:hypothetical protein
MDTGNATAPAPTGGALADGSYHLTASSYYPSLSTLAGCAVDPITTKLIVSSSSATSGTLQSATLTSAGFFISESTSYLMNDTSLSARIDCIAPDPTGLVGNAFQIAYSATPTELQIYASGDCGNHIEVYDLD